MKCTMMNRRSRIDDIRESMKTKRLMKINEAVDG